MVNEGMRFGPNEALKRPQDMSPSGGTPIDQPTSTQQAYEQAQMPPAERLTHAQEPHKVTTIVHNKNGRLDKLPELAKHLGVKANEGDGSVWLQVKNGERYDLFELLEAAR